MPGITNTEAQAICEMQAELADDGYGIAVYRDPKTDEIEGETFTPFIVQVVKFVGADRKMELVAAGRAYRLIDALQDAYQSTPERVAA